MDPIEELIELVRPRYQDRMGRAKALDRRDRAFALARFVVFGAGAVVAWKVLFGRVASPFWIGVPIAVFLLLVLGHELTVQARLRVLRAVSYHIRILRSLGSNEEIDPREQGAAGKRRVGARTIRGRDERDGTARDFGHELFAHAGGGEHPYAHDLDLFDPGGLFERVSEARTHGGQLRLAEWLLVPAHPATIRERQAAVEELRRALDLREELAVSGEEFDAGVDPATLAAWVDDPANELRGGFVVPILLAVLSTAGLVVWIVGQGPTLLLGAVVLQIAYRLGVQRRLTGVAHRADQALSGLRVLTQVLRAFEKTSFTSPWLESVQSRLRSANGRWASAEVGRLSRLVDALEARRNAAFAVIAFLLLLDVIFAHAVERWRCRHADEIVGWLDAVSDLEAISSLSAYAFVRPGDPFPEILDAGPHFEGEALAHPLLGAGAVPNDIRLDRETQLWVVSGSNMSGKSTFLRTVGTMAVLAQAGAPVRAKRLAISPLRIGASLRVHDSIQEGVSHFYAEIRRLRLIVELAEDGGVVTHSAPPASASSGGVNETRFGVLFLVDEILQGTNSHDRRIGTEAILQSLLQRGAIGLVTTHDLALTEIAHALEPRARNVHFQDHLQDGKMVFDYRLQPGVVTHSNAVALMRAVGLPV